MTVSELFNLKVIEKKKAPHCFGSFYRVNNSSDEAELVTKESIENTVYYER